MYIKISFIHKGKEISRVLETKLLDKQESEIDQTDPEQFKNVICEFLVKSLHKVINIKFVDDIMKELLN